MSCNVLLIKWIKSEQSVIISMVALVLLMVMPWLEFSNPEKVNVHLQYHKLETEKDLNLLAYRPLLVVIAASFGFLWSLLAVHMIQLNSLKQTVTCMVVWAFNNWWTRKSILVKKGWSIYSRWALHHGLVIFCVKCSIQRLIQSFFYGRKRKIWLLNGFWENCTQVGEYRGGHSWTKHDAFIILYCLPSLEYSNWGRWHGQ